MHILVIDDEPAMHDAYRRTFETHEGVFAKDKLVAMAAELFGPDGDAGPSTNDASADHFDIDHAEQGLDALRMVAQALADGNPYQVAFVDIRMPPGIDGKETAKRIREIDPDINLVIVTGFSDYSPLEIAKVAGPIDKLYYISKPFEPEEVVHAARALSHRWHSDRELARIRNQLARQVVELEQKSTELAANEARANHLANHDSLTGSPNRLALVRTLSEFLNTTDKPVTLAIADLDRFKNINDTLGHVAGDELIRQACHKMMTVIGHRGMIARLGGDEFAIALFDRSLKDSLPLLDQIIAACNADFSIFGHQINIATSIGVVGSQGGTDAEPIDLLRLADLALYDAKRRGGNQARVFDQSMDESIRFRQQIEQGLHTAISNDELEVLYQPVVDRDNVSVVGFEALLRWHSPEHGHVSPAVFIPIAEESKLILELGDWATDQALRACLQWPDQYVSINFSPRQFKSDFFAENLIAKVAKYGVPASRVQIEITETSIFDDHDRAAKTMGKLRDVGFRIALDDFGTGYSSLFNIRNFPLDNLKIDKSFVESMGREPQSAAIINSVTHLARSLGLGVIAEGVETEIQFQALRLAGCVQMQGYLFGKAVPLEETRKLIARPLAVARAGMRKAS